MEHAQDNIDRRDFLRTVGAAGLGSILVSVDALAEATGQKTQQQNAPAQVPKRTHGKTGVEVSCLALGTNRLSEDSGIILRKAFEHGLTHWDTSPIYGGSERAIGNFISKNPDARGRLFISNKAWNTLDPAKAERSLQRSLQRMNTEYLDLFYGIHELYHPAQLTDEIEEWVKDAKKRKLIRFFGFSTHKNVARCLAAAAKRDWIDAVLFAYNFRLMQDPRIQAAIEKCHKAGVGLTAMKTQGHGQEIPYMNKYSIETEQDKKLVSHFLKRGFTQGQAKIKLVLQDERISSACVGMSNIAVLTSNIAATLDKTRLSQVDVDVFAEYARATKHTYCAGCAHICDAIVGDVPCLSDIMRCLMYCNSYGDKRMAKQAFARIPAGVRARLASTDFSRVEAACPQKLPITRLVAEAVRKLG